MRDLRVLSERLRLPQPAVLVLLFVTCLGFLLLPVFLSEGEILALVLGAVGIAFVALAAVRPVWALAVLLLQFGFIPRENTLFGIYMPNQLKFLAPALLLGAVAWRLLHRKSFRPAPLDAVVGLFAVWCPMSLLATSTQKFMKYYFKQLGFPILVYYSVRTMDLSPTQFRRMLRLLLAGVVLTSALMFHEGRHGRRILYGAAKTATYLGARTATGPFPDPWTASAWLALWVPFFAVGWNQAAGEAAAHALGWVTGVVGIVSTLERSALMAMALSIVLSLLMHRAVFRPKRLIWFLALLAVMGLYLLRAGGSAHALKDRFQEDDPLAARRVYRAAGLAFLRSPEWNPLWGAGIFNFGDLASKYAPEGRVAVWGRVEDAQDLLGRGSGLHNVPLALLVETGTVGFLLVLVAGGLVARRVLALFRARPGLARGDAALLVAMSASILSVVFVGNFQHTYTMESVNCGLFTLLALLEDDWKPPIAQEPGSPGPRPTT